MQEAEKRGLLNLKSTPDCVPYLLNEKNVRLFINHKVFNHAELEARHEIMMEHYVKVLNIEALTMLDMARQDILPAVSRFVRELTDTALAKKALGGIDASYETETAAKLSSLLADAFRKTDALDKAMKNASGANSSELARYFRENIFTGMNALRSVVDEMESLTAASAWPYPSYGDMLFSVK